MRKSNGKRLLAGIVAVAVLAVCMVIPVAAEGSSVCKAYTDLENSSYYVYDFTSAANASSFADSSNTNYGKGSGTTLTTASNGIKISGVGESLNNYIELKDVPTGKWFAKIVYKYDNVELTDAAAGALNGSASISNGADFTKYVDLTVAEGEKTASIKRENGVPIETGRFVNSVINVGTVASAGLKLFPADFSDEDGEDVEAATEMTIKYIALFSTEKAAKLFELSDTDTYIGPKDMLDFSFYNGEQNSNNLNDRAKVQEYTNNAVSATTPQWGGPALTVRNNNWMAGKTGGYNGVKLTFANADPTRDYYVRVVYKVTEPKKMWPNDDNIYMGVGWHQNYNGVPDKGIPAGHTTEVINVDKDSSGNLASDSTWKVKVMKVKSSKNDNDIYYKQLRIMLSNIEDVTYYKYVALFDTEEEALNYDPSFRSVKVKINGEDRAAVVDSFNKTAVVKVGNESDVRQFSIVKNVGDVTLELYNGQSNNSAHDMVLADPIGSSSTEGTTAEGYKYQEAKYNVKRVERLGDDDLVEWTVRVQYVPEKELKANVTKNANDIEASFVNTQLTGEEEPLRVLAVHNADGILVGIKTSRSSDKISVGGLESGTYSARAFLWDSAKTIRPLLNTAAENIIVD